MTAPPATRLMERFPDARPNGTGWMAKCPAHEDHNPSLSISQGEDGRVLLHCHAGCPLEAVLSAAGLTKKDLFLNDGHPSTPARQEIPYTYQDETGKSLFRVVRGAVRDGKKTFWQQRPDGRGGWTNSASGVRKVLFRLPELTEADPSEPVLIVEGEKDVLKAVELGFIATTSPGGAGKWTEETEAEHHYGDALRGRNVVIIPDNDYAGRKHALSVQQVLRPICASVRQIDLPDLPPKGDLSDWVQAGGTAEKLRALLSGENLAFIEASRSYRELMNDRTPRPPSVLGDGLLYARQIGQIHGADGSRKSWESLHLLVDAATGRLHWGLTTRDGGIRCGLVSLEDDLWILQDRLSAIVLATDADEDLLTTNLHIICPPFFDTPWDMVDPAGRSAIKAWVRKNALDLVIIDHLSKAHGLPDERDLRPVSNAALEIARECTCGVLFDHHDRKGLPGSGSRVDAGASRGDSRFSADCRLRIAMKEIKDRIQLTVEKSTARRKPAPIWLRQEESGVLAVTSAPARNTEEAEHRRERMLELISDAMPEGTTPKALAAELGVSERTVTTYGRQLEGEELITRTGKAQGTRYVVRKVEEPSGSLPDQG